MDALQEWLVGLLSWTPLRAIADDVFSAAVFFAASLAAMLAFEWRAGKALDVYRSRHFITDLIYRVFFSVYTVLIYTPVTEAVNGRWPELATNALDQAPLWVSIPVYLVLFDFLAYWIHRFQHTSLWWPFHRVHHSQERMTFATGYRNHPIDQMLAHSVTFLPLIVLGAPAISFLPYSLALSLVDATHHANLDWTWSPVRKVFVSPVFHAAHHSTDEEYYDANYGALLSTWDYLFGTAKDVTERPAEIGVVGWQVRESFLAHLISPFVPGSVRAERTERRRDQAAPDDESSHA